MMQNFMLRIIFSYTAFVEVTSTLMDLERKHGHIQNKQVKDSGHMIFATPDTRKTFHNVIRHIGTKCNAVEKQRLIVR